MSTFNTTISSHISESIQVAKTLKMFSVNVIYPEIRWICEKKNCEQITHWIFGNFVLLPSAVLMQISVVIKTKFVSIYYVLINAGFGYILIRVKQWKWCKIWIQCLPAKITGYLNQIFEICNSISQTVRNYLLLSQIVYFPVNNWHIQHTMIAPHKDKTQTLTYSSSYAAVTAVYRVSYIV